MVFPAAFRASADGGALPTIWCLFAAGSHDLDARAAVLAGESSVALVMGCSTAAAGV
jgi:hypothetical protein